VPSEQNDLAVQVVAFEAARAPGNALDRGADEPLPAVHRPVRHDAGFPGSHLLVRGVADPRRRISGEPLLACPAHHGAAAGTMTEDDLGRVGQIVKQLGVLPSLDVADRTG
jgi:hypothetical protein